MAYIVSKSHFLIQSVSLAQTHSPLPTTYSQTHIIFFIYHFLPIGLAPLVVLIFYSVSGGPFGIEVRLIGLFMS